MIETVAITLQMVVAVGLLFLVTFVGGILAGGCFIYSAAKLESEKPEGSTELMKFFDQ